MITIVQKFGGTSMGSIERIRHVAERVRSEVDAGAHVAVVVSAMAGVTNQMVSLVTQISPFYDSAEYDVVVASGEQVTSGLLALALHSVGVAARSWQGWQVPISSDRVHGRARITALNAAALKESMASGQVAVIAGFQAVTAEGRITTLGRGGSDTTAVELAAALGAERCDIYTDVDGIYTADPRIVPKARKLDKVSYTEVLEMSSLGAKVLQVQSVAAALHHGVKVRVLSSFEDSPGTLVIPEEERMEKEAISGICLSQEEIMLILVGGDSTLSPRVLGECASASVPVDMVMSASLDGGNVFCLTLPASEGERMGYLLLQKKDELGFERLEVNANIAKVSLIGMGLRSNPTILKKMMETITRLSVKILVFAATEVKASVIVPREYGELLVRALHTTYGLDVEQ